MRDRWRAHAQDAYSLCVNGGSSAQCSGSVAAGCSRIDRDGHNTLTITLGKESSGQPTKTTPTVAVYTPDPALGVSGTISTPSEEHF